MEHSHESALQLFLDGLEDKALDLLDQSDVSRATKAGILIHQGKFYGKT